MGMAKGLKCHLESFQTVPAFSEVAPAMTIVIFVCFKAKLAFLVSCLQKHQISNVRIKRV